MQMSLSEVGSEQKQKIESFSGKRSGIVGRFMSSGDITKFSKSQAYRDGKIEYIASGRLEKDNPPTAKWSEGG